MKSFPTLLLALVMVTTVQAGIAGWFSSETRDWAFIQKTGGIRIAPPMHLNGKIVLPVIYPSSGNSDLAVREIKLKRKDGQLAIQVVTQLAAKGHEPVWREFVDLSEIPPGSYAVYYETFGDPAKKLGQIVLK